MQLVWVCRIVFRLIVFRSSGHVEVRKITWTKRLGEMAKTKRKRKVPPAAVASRSYVHSQMRSQFTASIILGLLSNQNAGKVFELHVRTEAFDLLKKIKSSSWSAQQWCLRWLFSIWKALSQLETQRHTKVSEWMEKEGRRLSESHEKLFPPLTYRFAMRKNSCRNSFLRLFTSSEKFRKLLMM